MESGLLQDRFGSTGGSGSGAGGGKPEAPFTALLVPSLKLRSFPTGEQQKLTINNKETGIHFAFGGACAAMEPPARGVYSGTTFEEVLGGNLEYDREGTVFEEEAEQAPTQGGWEKQENEEKIGK
jgi:hypothetical protein